MDQSKPESVDLIRELGPLAFASRLKRLQDRLFRDVSQIYSEQEVDFEPRWFLVFNAVLKMGPTAITSVAQALGVSHAAVHQTAAELLNSGLIGESRDPADERKRLLTATKKGRTAAKELTDVWNDIATATEDVISESGVDLLSALEDMERSLDDIDLVGRITRARLSRSTPKVEIVPYSAEFKDAFEQLNLEWIRQYFTVEPEDTRMLRHPEAEIIERGGAILFALVNGEVAGTCALLRQSDQRFELAKMAVARPYRGLGVGETLGKAMVECARKLGASTLFLLTSDKLQPAIRLYRRLGFRKTRVAADETLHYKRCTFSMEMQLRRTISQEVSRRVAQ
jgi:DNA-binding MarR family transcriptional regulator/N-acetylglutamate synthase-like GNAT family acetyltransferase